MQKKLTLAIDEEIYPTQQRFYEDDKHFIVGYVGGWGSGKSHIGARKSFKLATINKKTPGIIAGPTFGQVMETAYPAFVEYLDDIGMPFYEVRGQRPGVILPWGNPKRRGPGWIYFRSLDKPDALKGGSYGWAWVDELGAAPKGEDAWGIIISRIRHPDSILRQIIVTTTGEAPWMRQRFETDGNPDYTYYRASTRENLALPREYIDHLEHELPDDLKEVYIEGGFLPPQTGLVYKAFSGANIYPAQYIKELPLIHSLDFGVHPASSIIGQTDGNVAWVLGEIVLPRAEIHDTAREFIKRCGAHKAGVKIYGDPSGRARTANSKSSCYDILREMYYKKFGEQNVSFRYRLQDPGYHGRVNPVNRMFFAPTGERRLFVHPRCKHLIYDVRNVPWTEDGKIDKTVKHRIHNWTISHSSDALAYWIEAAFPIMKPIISNF